MSKVLRFTASWCQPCKGLAMTLADIETNIPIEVIDIDKSTDTPMFYGVRGVPTLIKLDENNTEVGRLTGMQTKEKLTEFLNG
jgi:thiol-disulfide isomerase/thioredoxin